MWTVPYITVHKVYIVMFISNHLHMFSTTCIAYVYVRMYILCEYSTRLPVSCLPALDVYGYTYIYSETSLIRHLYNPTFSLIRPLYKVQSPYVRKYGKRHSIIQQPPNPTLFSGPIDSRIREVSLYKTLYWRNTSIWCNRIHTLGSKVRGMDHPDSRAILYEEALYRWAVWGCMICHTIGTKIKFVFHSV